MPLNLMFKDFELKTDKLDSEFTLRIPDCPSLTSSFTSRITTGTVAAI